PVTAADVVWTFQAQTSKEVGWSYGDVKDQIEGVVAVDPHTVRFDFKSVYSSQLLDANEGAILPKHVWSQLPFSEWRHDANWFHQHLVVDGPFTLSSWKPQEQIVLERNRSYYEHGRPRVDRVIFRVIPEKNSQLTQLMTGALDFVEAVPPGKVPELRRATGVRVIRLLTRQYDYVCWNTARPFFSNPDLRRAMTLAIDRRALIDSLWYGFGKVADSPILSNVWAHDPKLKPWPYDPTQARALLARHGWIDHDGDGIRDKDGVPFSFELLTNSDNRQRVDATVMIQSQLQKIGVEVKPRAIEFNSLVSRETEHRFDAVFGAWGMDTSLDLRYAFHSDSISNGYNFGNYSNPKVDRLIEEAHRQSSLAVAKERLIQIQEILHHDQPMTFLLEPEQLDAARDRVKDAQPNALSSLLDLKDWWLAGRK
ncbi:MAG TPA: ABC transporter substrate-binding protein, partial [Candidatus Krumholzibacteria bacterium]|nr:ABC transporter substrate-binding protein [Candidatus Krumholzibacteria bacterium]